MPNTLQDTTETFTGEDFRIVFADNVTTFNGRNILQQIHSKQMMREMVLSDIMIYK